MRDFFPLAGADSFFAGIAFPIRAIPSGLFGGFVMPLGFFGFFI